MGSEDLVATVLPGFIASAAPLPLEPFGLPPVVNFDVTELAYEKGALVGDILLSLKAVGAAKAALHAAACSLVGCTKEDAVIALASSRFVKAALALAAHGAIALKCLMSAKPGPKVAAASACSQTGSGGGGSGAVMRSALCSRLLGQLMEPQLAVAMADAVLACRFAVERLADGDVLQTECRHVQPSSQRHSGGSFEDGGDSGGAGAPRVQHPCGILGEEYTALLVEASRFLYNIVWCSHAATAGELGGELYGSPHSGMHTPQAALELAIRLAEVLEQSQLLDVLSAALLALPPVANVGEPPSALAQTPSPSPPEPTPRHVPGAVTPLAAAAQAADDYLAVLETRIVHLAYNIGNTLSYLPPLAMQLACTGVGRPRGSQPGSPEPEVGLPLRPPRTVLVARRLARMVMTPGVKLLQMCLLQRFVLDSEPSVLRDLSVRLDLDLDQGLKLDGNCDLCPTAPLRGSEMGNGLNSSGCGCGTDDASVACTVACPGPGAGPGPGPGPRPGAGTCGGGMTPGPWRGRGCKAPSASCGCPVLDGVPVRQALLRAPLPASLFGPNSCNGVVIAASKQATISKVSNPGSKSAATHVAPSRPAALSNPAASGGVSVASQEPTDQNQIQIQIRQDIALLTLLQPALSAWSTLELLGMGGEADPYGMVAQSAIGVPPAVATLEAIAAAMRALRWRRLQHTRQAVPVTDGREAGTRCQYPSSQASPGCYPSRGPSPGAGACVGPGPLLRSVSLPSVAGVTALLVPRRLLQVAARAVLPAGLEALAAAVAVAVEEAEVDRLAAAGTTAPAAGGPHAIPVEPWITAVNALAADGLDVFINDSDAGLTRITSAQRADLARHLAHYERQPCWLGTLDHLVRLGAASAHPHRDRCLTFALRLLALLPPGELLQAATAAATAGTSGSGAQSDVHGVTAGPRAAAAVAERLHNMRRALAGLLVTLGKLAAQTGQKLESLVTAAEASRAWVPAAVARDLGEAGKLKARGASGPSMLGSSSSSGSGPSGAHLDGTVGRSDAALPATAKRLREEVVETAELFGSLVAAVRAVVDSTFGALGEVEPSPSGSCPISSRSSNVESRTAGASRGDGVRASSNSGTDSNNSAAGCSRAEPIECNSQSVSFAVDPELRGAMALCLRAVCRGAAGCLDASCLILGSPPSPPPPPPLGRAPVATSAPTAGADGGSNAAVASTAASTAVAAQVRGAVEVAALCAGWLVSPLPRWHAAAASTALGELRAARPERLLTAGCRLLARVAAWGPSTVYERLSIPASSWLQSGGGGGDDGHGGGATEVARQPPPPSLRLCTQAILRALVVLAADQWLGAEVAGRLPGTAGGRTQPVGDCQGAGVGGICGAAGGGGLGRCLGSAGGARGWDNGGASGDGDLAGCLEVLDAAMARLGMDRERDLVARLWPAPATEMAVAAAGAAVGARAAAAEPSQQHAPATPGNARNADCTNSCGEEAAAAAHVCYRSYDVANGTGGGERSTSQGDKMGGAGPSRPLTAVAAVMTPDKWSVAVDDSASLPVLLHRARELCAVLRSQRLLLADGLRHDGLSSTSLPAAAAAARCEQARDLNGGEPPASMNGGSATATWEGVGFVGYKAGKGDSAMGETPTVAEHAVAVGCEESNSAGGADATVVSLDVVLPSLRCANPGCSNFACCREADLPLRLCSGCRMVRYCCRECQTAHWREGHSKECGRRGAAGAGTP